MSLKTITIRCDWPDCQDEVTISDYPGALRDRKWVFKDTVERGPHLCQLHRFRNWAELDEALLKDEKEE